MLWLLVPNIKKIIVFSSMQMDKFANLPISKNILDSGGHLAKYWGASLLFW